MIEGTMTFASRVDGVELDLMRIASSHPSMTKIELSSSNQGDLKLEVSMAEISDQMEARAIALKEACRIADRLAVWLGKSVAEPRLTEEALFESIVDESGSTVSQHMLVQMVPLEAHASCVNKLGDTSLADLKETLSQPTLPGESNYVVFRIALGATDPASKFLALYQILSLLAKTDNQGEIDKLILNHQKVPVTKTKPSGGKFTDETTYTRLRNEYMHVRNGVTMSATRAEMESHLDNLISLVRTAIKEPKQLRQHAP